ncbi:PP2C family protein-serine/threonine phosphatase [Actinomadura latina]|uniref:Serine/threonine-protein phosphatase n=1 Tax=Actinomadura latina TaxID=163603 RepID=A0A846YT45_9ACTN|nr:PP2C family protein-serine/threonine phosphatase [Actinomadura latina]NKZ03519.1 serine/threonine-protein phosphatase [Actinomadura latina]
MPGEPADDDLPAALEAAMWAAPPHELIDVATGLLGRHAGATGAEVLLVDYRQAFLVRTVPGDGEGVPVDNTAPGHAFAAQRAIGEGDALHLPMTVKGERLGVLTVRLPDGGPGWLAAFADALARALKIADGGTDLYRRLRRRTRLTLAAEMQWDLLPPPAYNAAEFRFAGQLEPAYAVWGDNFDWSVSAEKLTLTVSNGMGSGTRAAALTHLAISALRNARRSGAGIVDQAALGDQALFARHRGDQHVATLLLEFELGTGRVRVVDAGSPRIYRLRGGATDAIDFDAQMPLGMFGDTRYTTEEFTVERGDRLVVVSDGVHGAQSPSGVPFGPDSLLQALRATRLQDPPEAVRTVVRRFVEYHDEGEPADDAVIVCIDWTGRDR